MLIVGSRRNSRSRVQPPPYPPPPIPGYPYQPGSWPSQPPYPYPPSPYHGFPQAGPARPPAASSGTALIVIGSIMLALGVLGIAGRLAQGSSTSPEHSPHQSDTATGTDQWQVGQCLAEFNVRIGMLTSSADCDDATSTYEIASEGDPKATCPDGKRDGSVYSILANDSLTLCLLLNLREGHCYKRMQGAGTVSSLSPVDCDDSRYADVKVIKRVDGSTDTALCPADAVRVTYPTPARLYCLSQ